MKVLLTGGGTGGHVIPNIALLDSLQNRGFEVTYMGENNSIEERLCSKYHVDFQAVTCVKFTRGKLLTNIKIPYLLIKGVREAKRTLMTNSVDVVFAKGGFVSLPACLAAKRLNIPVICHESDSSLGLANRIISRFARLLITNKKIDNVHCKQIKLGNPVREEIFHGNRLVPLEDMRYTKGKPFLLIMGGSSGAKTINDFVRDNIDILTQKYNVLHITGKGKNTISHKDYKGVEFTHNIADYFALADIVISRSGAGAISELLALGKRCLFIPLENKSSRGDQVENALSLQNDGMALMLRESELNILTVMNKLEECATLYKVDSYYDRKTPDKIVSAIEDVANMGKIKK